MFLAVMHIKFHIFYRRKISRSAHGRKIARSAHRRKIARSAHRRKIARSAQYVVNTFLTTSFQHTSHSVNMKKLTLRFVASFITL